jgi:hypothetical protein
MYSFPTSMEMGIIRGDNGVIYDHLMQVLTILIVSKWKGTAAPPCIIRSTPYANIGRTQLKPAKPTQPAVNPTVNPIINIKHTYRLRSKRARFKSNVADGVIEFTDIWVVSEEELAALDLNLE